MAQESGHNEHPRILGCECVLVRRRRTVFHLFAKTGSERRHRQLPPERAAYCRHCHSCIFHGAAHAKPYCKPRNRPLQQVEKLKTTLIYESNWCRRCLNHSHRRMDIGYPGSKWCCAPVHPLSSDLLVPRAQQGRQQAADRRKF